MKIRWLIFGKKHSVGYLGLQVLDLSDNQLLQVPNRVFSGLSSLQQLYLGGNLLSELTSEIFSNLTRLSVLFLNDNVISVIANDTFVSLENLEILSIAENMLHDIHVPILHTVGDTLLYLNISYNHLIHLNKYTLFYASNMTHLSQGIDHTYRNLSVLEHVESFPLLNGDSSSNQITHLESDPFTSYGTLIKEFSYRYI